MLLVPAMSICAHDTPFYTKLYKNAAAWLDDAYALPGAFDKSAVFAFTISW
jgi:hypothetical protein